MYLMFIEIYEKINLLTNFYSIKSKNPQKQLKSSI